MIGGKLRKNTLAMVDSNAVAAIEPLSVHTLFISSDGFSATKGLITPCAEEAALKQAMIAAAQRVVALVDHSKLGHDHFIRFAEWSDVDVLVTNSEAGATVELPADNRIDLTITAGPGVFDSLRLLVQADG